VIGSAAWGDVVRAQGQERGEMGGRVQLSLPNHHPFLSRK